MTDTTTTDELEPFTVELQAYPVDAGGLRFVPVIFGGGPNVLIEFADDQPGVTITATVPMDDGDPAPQVQLAELLRGVATVLDQDPDSVGVRAEPADA